jgi:DNA-binding PadR family transcriptional regulator
MSHNNKTVFVILGMLSHMPMTGYDIKKRIENSVGYFWNAGFGQIYPALKKLEDEGLVSKEVELDENRPNRKVYTITESGRKKLKEWLSIPSEREKVRYEVLLKLFFGSQVSLDKTISNIEGFRSRYSKEIEELGNMEKFLKNKMENGVLQPERKEDHIFYYLTLLFGQYIYKAYIEWADKTIGILKDNKYIKKAKSGGEDKQSQ